MRHLPPSVFLCSKLGGVAVLVLAVFLSAKWMVGDFYGERVASSIESWSKKRVAPPGNVLIQHLSFAEKALAWSPSNPRYKELYARLKSMQMRHLATSEDILLYAREITELHRQAAKERPQWPFSWSNLAFMKSLLRQYDSEYYQAVQNTLSYGAYESAALSRVVRSALPIWGQLDGDTKELVYQAIANGSNINPSFAKRLRKTLVEKGLVNEVCAQVRFDSDRSKKKLCR